MTRPRTSTAPSKRARRLAAGRPMDRLICGDVGFGKTEVALRAAFAAAINGKQVAVVVPTTLLARQHYKNFTARFAGLPIRSAQMSRMVAAADSARRKEALADGRVDIVVGTHAVLGKTGQLQGPRPGRHRRGAAFRRRPQGTAEGIARRRPCADAVRDADPAHPATGDDRRARIVDHRHAAGRPSRGAHFRRALRRSDRPRSRCCASVIAAGRAFTSVRASKTSTRPRRGCGRMCRKRNSSSRMGRWPPPNWKSASAPSTTANTIFCSRPISSNPASIFPPPIL